MHENIILMADSYKFSQYLQYPEGTEYIYSYIESRGGIYDKLVFLGTQMFLREYLSQPLTTEMVNRAEKIVLAHGEPFNRAGFDYIVEIHGGVWPVEIHALDEGTVIGTKQVLLWIKNTDPKCAWVTSFLETALLRAIWYPTTVASNSYHSKELILDALKKSGDESLIPFKLHDFGARGVSSYESACIGGLAHLTVFHGTDTISALDYAIWHYDAELVPGFSVPAMEHSTVTSWTRDGEVESYRNMINTFGAPGKIVSIVADSYDIFNACRLFGTELKQDIIDSGCTLVVRPDSGDPAVVIVKILHILEQYFGAVTNDKHYKVLNNVRVLWGDGINHQSIRSILFSVMLAGYSADNVTFGQGGALLQINNRDDLKFAMKCSAAFVNGKWVDVYKDPITDPGKQSKKGQLDLILMQDDNGNDIPGAYITINDKHPAYGVAKSQLKLRYKDGLFVNHTTFDEIRQRVLNG